MQPDFYIREFQENDYPETMVLWESLGLGNAYRGDDLKVILRTIRMGGQLLLMIDKENGSIIGTSWLTVDGRRTFIHHFGIKSDYQGNGLAKILLDASMKHAKTLGMQVKLEVHKDNVKALNLYKKAGFAYLGDYQVYILRDISSIW